jgi:hypothetical protein|tara:strand:+ start:896 stop:1117 length:222 start_codon:yes stop_codon:yes gene_type:complete
MNYLYNRMLEEGEIAIFDRDELRQFEDYVSKNYKEFYDSKVVYDVTKEGEKFLVTLFENPLVTLEDILLDIKS